MSHYQPLLIIATATRCGSAASRREVFKPESGYGFIDCEDNESQDLTVVNQWLVVGWY